MMDTNDEEALEPIGFASLEADLNASIQQFEQQLEESILEFKRKLKKVENSPNGLDDLHRSLVQNEKGSSSSQEESVQNNVPNYPLQNDSASADPLTRLVPDEIPEEYKYPVVQLKRLSYNELMQCKTFQCASVRIRKLGQKRLRYYQNKAKGIITKKPYSTPTAKSSAGTSKKKSPSNSLREGNHSTGGRSSTPIKPQTPTFRISTSLFGKGSQLLLTPATGKENVVSPQRFSGSTSAKRKRDNGDIDDRENVKVSRRPSGLKPKALQRLVTESINSYSMTPPKSERKPLPLKDENDYGIDSGSSDDEEHPKREIPAWAGKSNLLRLAHRENSIPVKLRMAFMPSKEGPLSLVQIFGNKINGSTRIRTSGVD